MKTWSTAVTTTPLRARTIHITHWKNKKKKRRYTLDSWISIFRQLSVARAICPLRLFLRGQMHEQTVGDTSARAFLSIAIPISENKSRKSWA